MLFIIFKVLNKLCNFTAYKLFVSTNKQLTDPMDSMADPLFSSYSAFYKIHTLVERVYLHLIFTQKDNLWLKKIIKGHKRPIKAVEGG
jgi:hypothetical protein